MVDITQIMLLKEAVATTALEHGWDKEKQNEMFEKALAHLVYLEDISYEYD